MHPTRRDLLVMGAAASLAFPACRLVTGRKKESREITVGAIGIFPNPAERFEGELPETALKAAVGRLNALGGVLGREVVFRGAQAGTDAEAFEGFRRLAADPSVVGIILATPVASDRIVDEAARRGIPLIVTAFDLASSGGLWPEARHRRSIFQFALPETWALEALVDYCRNDRGYRRIALLYDDFLFPNVARQFAAAVAEMTVTGAEQFGEGQRELEDQVRAFAGERPEAFFVWSGPEALATVAQILHRSGSSYLDTPTAKSAQEQWRPQLVGAPIGMLERDWAALAGNAARIGSVTAGDVGGFRKGPEWLPEIWGENHAPDWERIARARRGSRAVVDSAYALLEAARRAGSSDRDGVVEMLESGKDFQFASTRFGFSPEDHVAIGKDDVALFTLERKSPLPVRPPYSVGREWEEGTAIDPDMTLLVRPRLEENRRSDSGWIGRIVSGGFGTSCTLMPDGSLSNVCPAH